MPQEYETKASGKPTAENIKVLNYKAGDPIMMWVPSIPKGKSEKIICKWHGPYSVAEVNKGKQVTLTMPDGRSAIKDMSVHQARVNRFKNRRITATDVTSEGAFE